MARRPPIDLAARINGHGTGDRANVNFPVRLRPIYYDADFSYESVPNRLAVVREDTGEALAVVSDQYTLVPHRRILDAVEEAINTLQVGEIPRGIFVDRRGARLKALFKFPALERQVRTCDTICPCVKVQNTYDATSRIAVHIGAFRFVCTNLAVGGGGAFASGARAGRSRPSSGFSFSASCIGCGPARSAGSWRVRSPSCGRPSARSSSWRS